MLQCDCKWKLFEEGWDFIRGLTTRATLLDYGENEMCFRNMK